MSNEEVFATYDSLDDVPDVSLRDLFTEREDGTAELTGIDGIKTVADVKRLQTSLHKAQDDNKSLKARLRDQRDAVEDESNDLRSRVEALESENRELHAGRAKDRFRAKMSVVLADAGVLEVARSDALRLAEDVFEHRADDDAFTTKANLEDGTPPGLRPDEWLRQQQQTRPHWWPASRGGGARGGRRSGAGANGFNGPNPWSAANWNVTQQHLIQRDHGRATAERLARQAGTRLGGGRGFR